MPNTKTAKGPSRRAIHRPVRTAAVARTTLPLFRCAQWRFFNRIADQLFLCPTTRRNYIVSESAGEGDVPGEDHVIVASADSSPVTYQFAVYFKLNIHPDVLRRFHEQIGLKYRAWDLSSNGGWDRMLVDNFRQPIEATLQREGRQYTAADLYTKIETLDQLSQDVGSQLKESINSKLGGDFFCGRASRRSATTARLRLRLQADQAAAAGDRLLFWVIPQGNNLTLQTPPPSPGG